MHGYLVGGYTEHAVFLELTDIFFEPMLYFVSFGSFRLFEGRVLAMLSLCECFISEFFFIACFE